MSNDEDIARTRETSRGVLAGPFFFTTLFVSLLATTLGSSSVTRQVLIPRNAFWTRVVTTSIPLDPMVVILVSLMIVAAIVFVRGEVRSWKKT